MVLWNISKELLPLGKSSAQNKKEQNEGGGQTRVRRHMSYQSWCLFVHKTMHTHCRVHCSRPHLENQHRVLLEPPPRQRKGKLCVCPKLVVSAGSRVGNTLQESNVFCARRLHTSGRGLCVGGHPIGAGNLYKKGGAKHGRKTHL
jgi:hypothetical protein